MVQNKLLTYLYGLVLGIIIFLVIRWVYSVYYTPGVRMLYNSPVTQQLFPNAMNKVFPTWGYNRLGMYDGQEFKYGQGSFYPESGPAYKPTKYGYGGPSPEGGERKSFPIPKEVSVGYWGKSPSIPRASVEVPVYGSGAIPSQESIEIGWWGD